MTKKREIGMKVREGNSYVQTVESHFTIGQALVCIKIGFLVSVIIIHSYFIHLFTFVWYNLFALITK